MPSVNVRNVTVATERVRQFADLVRSVVGQLEGDATVVGALVAEDLPSDTPKAVRRYCDRLLLHPRFGTLTE